MRSIRSGFNMAEYMSVYSPEGSPCVSGEVMDLSNVDNEFARVSSLLYDWH